MKHYKLFIDGNWIDTPNKAFVQDKYTGEPFASIAQAEDADVERAVQSAKNAFRKIKLSPYHRYEILLKVSKLLLENKEHIAEILSREVGKPLKESRGEVQRAAFTFEIAAEEAKRITGEMVPVEATPGSENRLAFTLRSPLGVVCAITPFNFPLNLAAHKIAPALAAGNAVVLKPTQQCPVNSALLVQLLLDAGLPPGYINLVFGSGAKVGEQLLHNKDINFYSFTGSAQVGERIRDVIGLRNCTLELGSNSAVIVHHDADIMDTSRLCVAGSFANAGQVCISVQRVYVHQDIYSKFLSEMKKQVEKLVVGNPLNDTTDMGPMISEKEVERIDQWVKEAVGQGAEVVTGGRKMDERTYLPTILTNVNREMKVVSNEVFAPVVVVIPYENIDWAINEINASQYGLQAGVFTSNTNLAMKAAKKIHTGGVVIGDTSSYRTDSMPYGGVKRSGIGKEGAKYAIKELTEEKIVIFNLKNQ